MHRSIGHQCCDPLTAVKTGYPLTSITWPHCGIRCCPIEVKYFLKLSADNLLVSKWSRAQVSFFKFIWNKLCFCAAQLKFWFKNDLGRENSASCYRQGRQLLLTFLIMFTRWSPSKPIFMLWLVKIWQVRVMRKIYAASWILFTLTAESDRVLCQLVMFLTVFFHWMCKMKFCCYQESSVIHG